VLDVVNVGFKPFVFVLLTAATSLMAQGIRSHVVLQVVDNSGAVVTHAHVEIHPQLPTALEKQDTGVDGTLALSLAPGIYRISVDASGFKTWADEIEVKGSGVANLRVILQFAETSRSIEVCSSCPLIEVHPNWSPSIEVPRDYNRINRLLRLVEAFSISVDPPIVKTLAPIAGEITPTSEVIRPAGY
jgi:uncharacterized membrane protein